jgi:iron complex outermembrane receptor protein
MLWGLNYRSMVDRTKGKGVFALDPPDSQDNLFSGFVQDQIALLDSLKVTLGTQLEHNDFSGFEVQPTARVSWSPFRDQTLWGAASRAVRTPTRLERDIDISASDPARNPVLKLLGNQAFGSEKLFAYELGYRWQIGRALFVDLAACYNIYKGLASLELDPRFVDPQSGQTILPLLNKNLTDGLARGGEASVTLTPVRSWRLVANYTYLLLTLEPKGQDLNASAVPASSDLVAGQDTPAYATVDVRGAWRWKRLEFSLVGRNLAQSHHREFPGGTEMERAFYAKIAGRF